MAEQSLVRLEDIEAARRAVADALAQRDHAGAERALARYTPESQALVVQATFAEALERARAEGDSDDDAMHRAARASEEIVGALPDASAAVAIGEIPDPVLGVILGSSAGEDISMIAERADPDRIAELLVHDPRVFAFEYRDPETGELLRRLRTSHLVRMLWTLFQADDRRARQLLQRLHRDLVALPLAERLAGFGVGWDDPEGVHEEEDHTETPGAGDAPDADDDDTSSFFRKLHVAEREGPGALDLHDDDLEVLLERIFELSPTTFREILARARELDVAEVRADIEREAGERVAAEGASAADDDMFEPLPPKRNG